MGLDVDFASALHKAFLGAGYRIPEKGAVLATVSDKDKAEALPLMKKFTDLGFTIWATSGPADFLEANGVEVKRVAKRGHGSPNVIDLIHNKEVDFVVNSLTKGQQPQRDGFQIRRSAVEFNIPCMTSLDTCRGLLEVIERCQAEDVKVKALQEYV